MYLVVGSINEILAKMTQEGATGDYQPALSLAIPELQLWRRSELFRWAEDATVLRVVKLFGVSRKHEVKSTNVQARTDPERSSGADLVE